MFESGYLKLGSLHGTPIRAHWTLPLGALIFSGFRFAPVFWLAFFGLVLLHELGHAAVVRRFRHRVLSIDITGFGGLCRWAGHATHYERAAIAWGGVAAQGVVLVATLLVLFVVGRPTSFIGAQLASVFVSTNLLLIALNLLPFPPLDGAEAWQLLKYVRRPRWPRSGGRSSRPRKSNGSAAQGGGREAPPRELADLLRQIGDEAGRARRGDQPTRRR